MFKAYEAKNDSPQMRAFMYLSLVRFFFAVVALIYVGAIAEWSNLNTVTELVQNKYFVGVVAVITFTTTYFFYSRRDNRYYENRFMDFLSLNKKIKIWMLVIFPFLILFGGVLSRILLFGGVIFGSPVSGLLN